MSIFNKEFNNYDKWRLGNNEDDGRSFDGLLVEVVCPFCGSLDACQVDKYYNTSVECCECKTITDIEAIPSNCPKCDGDSHYIGEDGYTAKCIKCSHVFEDGD